jgi:acyl carrier protein
MTKPEFLCLIDELLEMPEGTIQGSDPLEQHGWSSVSALGFMALADEQFGAPIAPAKLAKCQTADDLASFFPSQIAALAKGIL